MPLAARRLPAQGQGGDGRAGRALRALRQPREERRGRLRLGGRQGLALHQVLYISQRDLIYTGMVNRLRE